MMDEQTAQNWGTLIGWLLNPYMVGAILLLSAAAAAVVWRHTEEWQRAWMLFILLIYLIWLVVAIFQLW